MEKNEILKKLENLLQEINEIYTSVDIPKKEEEIADLEKITHEENFWNDSNKASEILKKIKSKKDLVLNIKNIKKQIEDNLELIEIIEESEYKNIEEDIEKLSKEKEELSLLLMLNKPYDNEDCILEIHSGAGGTEACDWANMLYRAYSRYIENHNFKQDIISIEGGLEVGIKSISIKVSGENAYGYLKNERGVHRLVRLSPFDSNNKRHTSFASIEVTPDIKEDIDINIDEKDLRIDIYRSSGNGGQGVNTTDSAVRITHIPTKIVVTCQNERSQIQNKEEALRVLKSKLLIIKLEEEENKLRQIKGEQKNIEFGSQIRSYVMQPYTMVKDHRTGYETSDVDKVLDGDFDGFIEENLKRELAS